MGDVSEEEIDAEDLDIVECELMETVDADDEGWQSDPDGGDRVEVFNPPRDDATAVFGEHNESVFCVTFDPTGTLLVSGGQDHVAVVRNVESKQTVFTTEGHQDSVIHVTFSSDGHYLATGDMAGGVRVWLRPSSVTDQWPMLLSETVGDLLWLRWWQPLSTGEPRAEKSIASPCPAILAAGDEDGLVVAWSVAPPNPASSQKMSRKAKYFAGAGFAAISGTFYSPSVNTDRPKLVVLYRDTVLKLWDIKTEEVLTSVRLITPAHLTGNPDEMQGEDEKTSVFCMTQPHPGTESIHQHSDLVIVGGMNCLLLAVIKSDKQTALFSSKCLPSILLEDCGSVETMDFSWTHPLFAFGTVSGTIGILDTVPVRIRQKWTYSTSIDEEDDTVGITGLLWSRNTPLLFTSTSDGAVVAWPGLSGSSELVGPAASGPSPLQIWWGHKAMIMDLALSPASSTTRSEQPGRKEFTVEKQIATASDDTTVRIFATTNLMPNC
ncbi:WD-repeat protein 1 [Fasciola hepatica]|uniref:WD-repeat protein 1 n=1 Tax=Fasciola hepatica TaxID=6192 RepID=A0A4E0R9Z5_FASHE|nr:WD-repeat protein 1 [Fasciola hepatica]